MTMTHKEALRVAAEKSIGMPGSTCVEDDIEAAIRAYVEARGLVMVQKDIGDAFSNSSLPKRMIDAGYEVLEQCDVDLMNSTGPDWDYGMQAVATFRAMLAAAPDPFTEE